jgi:hypothetical protein
VKDMLRKIASLKEGLIKFTVDNEGVVKQLKNQGIYIRSKMEKGDEVFVEKKSENVFKVYDANGDDIEFYNFNNISKSNLDKDMKVKFPAAHTAMAGCFGLAGLFSFLNFTMNSSSLGLALVALNTTVAVINTVLALGEYNSQVSDKKEITREYLDYHASLNDDSSVQDTE